MARSPDSEWLDGGSAYTTIEKSALPPASIGRAVNRDAPSGV